MAREDESLLLLEQLKKQADVIHAQQEVAIRTIREGFVQRTILFMDVVGSTAFKIEHGKNPEIWILRVKQFCTILANAVKAFNGNVIKYIGDEVMASFQNTNDALNLICRIAEIEESLKKATGYETRIKVAIDYGEVYELCYEDHRVPDPQGTIVDRCARIGKFAIAGEVLSSTSFVEKSPLLDWKKLGTTELKGLGKQIIYQLKRETADIEEKIEIKKRYYDSLIEERDSLRAEIAKCAAQNKELQNQIILLGERPVGALVGKSMTHWDAIQEEIDKLKEILDGVVGPTARYARFCFLYISQNGGDNYNKYDGKVFDELIEAKIVEDSGTGIYELNMGHPRNVKAAEIMDSIETMIRDYIRDNEQNPDDLFVWSLKDPEFWNKYIGENVL